MCRQMYLLYDDGCGFCVRCVAWLRAQPKFFPVVPLPSESKMARAMFPTLTGEGPPEELIVVADGKDVYRGAAAWIMCLYAMRRYRGLSFTFSDPAWRPLVRRAVGVLAKHRRGISTVFRLDSRPERTTGGGCAAGSNGGRC